MPPKRTNKTSKAEERTLPSTLFVVLALLGEGEGHGYKIEQQAFTRGFRYWTDVGRSSIYQALNTLLRRGLASARLQPGPGGPARKVYTISEAGRERLRRDALEHMARPAHPRSEIDLGLYALPFLDRKDALEALCEGSHHLQARAAFISERHTWCLAQGLELAALNFERPLLALRAELQWLNKLIERLEAGDLDLSTFDWQRYEYLEPPGPEFA